MATVADPLGSGFVTSLGHPGGNITGLSTMIAELSAKRLQLLKKLFHQSSVLQSSGIQTRRTATK